MADLPKGYKFIDEPTTPLPKGYKFVDEPSVAPVPEGNNPNKPNIMPSVSEPPRKSFWDVTSDIFSGAKSVLDAGHQFNKTMIQGTPVLGRFLQEDEDLTKFKENHPTATSIGNALGATAATVPFSSAMAARTGANLIPSILSQSGVFGTINAADKLAEKGQDTSIEDLKDAGISGAISGAGGAVLNKVLSPNALPLVYRQMRGPGGRFAGMRYLPDKHGGQQISQNAQPNIREIMAQLLGRGSTGLIGGGIGQVFGGPIGGAAGIALGALRPELIDALRNSGVVNKMASYPARYMGNQLMGAPGVRGISQAILNTLSTPNQNNQEDQGIQYVP